MAKNVVLEVKNLSKRYGKFTAVDNISFDLKGGEVLGLLGPNGAGKTTTIQMLLGITSASSGEISYFGRDFYKFRQQSLQKINFASAFNTLQGKITVWENLLVFGKLYGIKDPSKKIKELCEYFEISDFLEHKYWDLSSGQKTRVNLVKSLINDPEIILMDEPTASLDPDIADKTLTYIEDLRKRLGLSILFTSHDMDEVTRICDQVIFLDRGKIVAQDTPVGLTKKITTVYLQLTFDSEKRKVENYLKELNKSFEFLSKNIVRIQTSETEVAGLIFKIGNSGIWILDIEVKKPTLEDVFLSIARREKDAN